MRLVHPVSPSEFRQLIQRTIPPTGWSRRIAVAHSGGPDSTALLYLLTVLAQNTPRSRDAPETPSLPLEVLAIHVNHGLQSLAGKMEDIATSTATRLGATSVTERIPWGVAPFPAKPAEGAAAEKLARDARHGQLFAAMHANDTKLIAFAHHADDQVETCIMRMAKGSGMKGLAATRPVRRWGMGDSSLPYASFGALGMDTWIIRPLLQIPKDRLLATCEANRLDYIHDPTNFQPEVTLRNAIRGALRGDTSASAPAPINIAAHTATLRAAAPHVPPADQLREAVRLFGDLHEQAEAAATTALARSRRPSPAATLLLSAGGLAITTDPDARTAIVRRCLRFCSHGPWGSLWAEANGDSATLGRVVERFWPAQHHSLSARELKPFTMGAGVTAMPVALRPDGVVFRAPKGRSEGLGWLLHRSVPHRVQLSSTPAALSRGAPTEGVDVTDRLLEALESGGRSRYEMLFDHRFKIVFEVGDMPKHIGWAMAGGERVRVEFYGQWQLPRVVYGEDALTMEVGKCLWKLPGWTNTPQNTTRSKKWIQMEFVRSLDAV
ncbi:adenine nucleotide alpha hydrolases-like protein [Epithele typhae]|uniref:adenine nucleotide alpha hydrolases-like protein n=1 Tax=Epithele typhae TaxID=378194 RepID=UPI002007B24C|nr:adenine nucleotide alpha hydrolases-like protein [Epithele typhae]KAH9945806.1 adenine nucleotide alpha hydrolases-like protein [Epithele typhae]